MVDIKLFRKDNNLSQVELAEISGCTQGFISSLERKKRPVPDSIITKLISLEKYNIRYLVSNESQTSNKEVSKFNDEVKMSREVFDVLKNLSETVLSQQRTIEHIEYKKTHVLQGDNAECADASVLDLAK